MEKAIVLSCQINTLVIARLFWSSKIAVIMVLFYLPLTFKYNVTESYRYHGYVIAFFPDLLPMGDLKLPSRD